MKISTKNNNGFTVIELIIAMSVFSIIIFMGFNIINKYDKTSREQQNTTDVQMAINTINRYITKDLEKASGITLKINDEDTYSVVNGQEGKEEYLKNSLLAAQQNNKISQTQNESNLTYKYIINTNGDSEYSTYTVDLSYKKYSKFMICSISRNIENDSNIELLSNHKITKSSDEFSLPLVISDNNPYNVAIELQEKSNKINTYSFDVASRSLVASSSGGDTVEPEKPTPPTDIIYPDGVDKFNSTAIGFWIGDKTKFEEKDGKYKDSLYTWVDDGGSKKEAYGSQNIIDDEVFETSADNGNGNNGVANAHIGKDNSKWRVSVNHTSYKSKDIDTIKIYVSPYTTLEEAKIEFDKNKGTFIGIKKEGSSEYLNHNNNNKYILSGNQSGTWYEVCFEKNNNNNNNMANFDIVGKLKVDDYSKVDSGYAVIFLYEKTGNIIFTFNKSDAGHNNIKVNGLTEIYIPKKSSYLEEYINSPFGFGPISATQTQNMDIVIDTRNNHGQVRSDTLGNISISNESIKNVKKIRISSEGGIFATQIKGNGSEISTSLPVEITLPNNSEFRIFMNVKFESMVESIPGTLKIDLIY